MFADPRNYSRLDEVLGLYYRICDLLSILDNVDNEATDCLIQSNLIARAVGTLEHFTSILTTIDKIEVNETLEELIG